MKLWDAAGYYCLDTMKYSTAEAEAHLCTFLGEHFTFSEFSSFLRSLPCEKDHIPDLLLPGTCPWIDVVAHAVPLLRRRGLLNPLFFEKLTSVREHLLNEISALSREWCVVVSSDGKRTRRKKGIRLKLQLEFETVAESKTIRAQILALLRDHAGDASLQIEEFWRGSLWLEVTGPDRAIAVLWSKLRSGLISSIGVYPVEESMLRAQDPKDREVMELSDLDLLSRWKQGSHVHGTQLFQRYFDMTYRFFRNKVSDEASVEDLVQETFMKVLSTTPGAVSSFKVLLFRVAHNLLTRYFQRKLERVAPDTSLLSAYGESSAISVLERNQKAARLARALRTLPLEDRITLELYVGLGGHDAMSASEIAEVLGISISALKHRLRRAKIRLKEVLENTNHSGGGSSSVAA